MRENQKNDQEILLTRAEKSILVDALRWHHQRDDITDEEANAAKEAKKYLDETRCLDLSLIDGSLITRTILVEFSNELKPYIDSLEETGKAGEFFENNFNGIVKKIRSHSPERQNAFY